VHQNISPTLLASSRSAPASAALLSPRHRLHRTAAQGALAHAEQQDGRRGAPRGGRQARTLGFDPLAARRTCRRSSTRGRTRRSTSAPHSIGVRRARVHATCRPAPPCSPIVTRRPAGGARLKVELPSSNKASEAV